jgi:DNA-binding response OmpR family regulator
MATILIVDDDPAFMSDLEKMLSAAGYQVLTASDGNTAVELLEKQRNEINLSIVDLGLPGINGFELIGAISRRAHSSKVIATTGIYKDIHLEMSETLGADAAIRKSAQGRPLPESQWLATVRQLVGSSEREKRAAVGTAQGSKDKSEPLNGTGQ